MKMFSKRKGEVLNAIQGKSAEALLQILSELTPEEITKMTWPERKEFLRVVGTVFGISIDKEELIKRREYGIPDQTITVHVDGMPKLPNRVVSILAGNGAMLEPENSPTTELPPIEIDE